VQEATWRDKSMSEKKRREFLRNDRKKRGLTQKEVAEIIGISREFYCQIERGERAPGFNTAIRIADFFNVNVRMLTK
jgi:transcriptional regulator with XRE-family HTH domain